MHVYMECACQKVRKHMRDVVPLRRRCGVLAVKAGMTHEWDQWGAQVPLTVRWLEDCQVALT